MNTLSADLPTAIKESPATAPHPRPTSSRSRTENVHLNETTISGVVKKVVFQNGDVLFRLAQPLETERENILSVRIPSGQIDGALVSLGPGDLVQVSGYLAEAPQRMSLSAILEKLRLPDRIQSGDEGLLVGHITTQLVAQAFERLDVGQPLTNTVQLGGVIHKFYAAKADTIIRLDIYDRHTRVVEHNARVGLPHRQAHHVSLRLIGGKSADGHKPRLKTKGQVLASGDLRQYLYSESLKKIMMRARQFNRILDGDDERYLTLEAFYVVVRSAVYPDVFINPLSGK